MSVRYVLLLTALFAACSDEEPDTMREPSPPTSLLDADTRAEVDASRSSASPAPSVSSADSGQLRDGADYTQTVIGYTITHYPDGELRVQTPSGDTCIKNVGPERNLNVQSVQSKFDARIEFNGVPVVIDGKCA